jgi:glycosyltransferase involved in cell wall biosynthesis
MVLLNHYRQANIFVIPSRTESFGLVYAEAMSQGNPIIYSRGQGFDGFFENGTVGFAVDPFNVEEITAKVVEISKKYSFFSTNALSMVSQFRWDNQVKKLKNVYQSAVT